MAAGCGLRDGCDLDSDDLRERREVSTLRLDMRGENSGSSVSVPVSASKCFAWKQKGMIMRIIQLHKKVKVAAYFPRIIGYWVVRHPRSKAFVVRESGMGKDYFFTVLDGFEAVSKLCLLSLCFVGLGIL